MTSKYPKQNNSEHDIDKYNKQKVFVFRIWHINVRVQVLDFYISSV